MIMQRTFWRLRQSGALACERHTEQFDIATDLDVKTDSPSTAHIGTSLLLCESRGEKFDDPRQPPRSASLRPSVRRPRAGWAAVMLSETNSRWLLRRPLRAKLNGWPV